MFGFRDLFSLVAEDRVFGSSDAFISGSLVGQASRCAVAVVALDRLGGLPALAHSNPTDTRHQNIIWSWRQGDAGSNGDAALMLQNNSNRWASTNPLEVHQFLCGLRRSESGGDPNTWPDKNGQNWRVTSVAGTWFQGGQQCLREFGEDWVFSVPVSGYANIHAALASDVITTWLNYNDIKQENAWLINKRPVAEAGANQILECTSPQGAVATLNGIGSTDPEKDSLTYDWTGPFGTRTGPTVQVAVPLGTHSIRLVTDDGFSGVDPDELQVTVRDTTAPVIEKVSATPPRSWPPNHKMFPVTVDVTMKDACDPNAKCRIVSVTSNEPTNVNGAGKPNRPDWQITGPLTALLSAERSGRGSGRVYTLSIECVDAAGNKSFSATTVIIPHNGGRATVAQVNTREGEEVDPRNSEVYGPTGARRRSSSKKFCTKTMVCSGPGGSRAATAALTMMRRPSGATSNPPVGRALAAQTAAFSATNASPLVVYDTVMMRSPARYNSSRPFGDQRGNDPPPLDTGNPGPPSCVDPDAGFT